MHEEAGAVLDELEQLHARETEALRRMDAALIDELSSIKETLCERLGALSAALLPEHRPKLERIRAHAARNQLLIVHARDSVRTILSQATGMSFDAFPGARRPSTHEGIRLNVRV